jgi:hypothetical protein
MQLTGADCRRSKGLVWTSSLCMSQQLAGAFMHVPGAVMLPFTGQAGSMDHWCPSRVLLLELATDWDEVEQVKEPQYWTSLAAVCIISAEPTVRLSLSKSVASQTASSAIANPVAHHGAKRVFPAFQQLQFTNWGQQLLI